MPGKLHLLIVDDDPGFIEDFTVLSQDYFLVSKAASGEAALKQMTKIEPDAVILDLCLGEGIDGLVTLEEIRKVYFDIPVIMVTENASVETAVKAMKMGAIHYMSKHPNMKALQVIIERELSNIQWKTLYRNVIKKQFGEIVGESKVMQEIYKRIDLVADTKANILIEGESGTGKELVAREIHFRSKRSEYPFVAVNCAAIPDALFESELFGHEKGAFTGAGSRKRGKFETAHGGTIFLDEIGSLAKAQQAKLLRVLEDGSVTRVGSNSPVDVDVRIISASNQSLADLVRNGQFREDLFHRVNGIDIILPPLRDRGEDIVQLASYFHATFDPKTRFEEKFSQDAVQVMNQYSWPGNVRELRNVIERMHIIVNDRQVEPADLQLQFEGDKDLPAFIRNVLFHPYDKAKNDVVMKFKQQYLRALMERTGGNVAEAARMAKIPRQSLYRMLEELE